MSARSFQPFSCNGKVMIGAPPAPAAEAMFRLDSENLEVCPRDGSSIRLPLGEVDRLELGDYRLRVQSEDGLALECFHLGQSWESFLREVNMRRNEVILDEMLGGEKLRKDAFFCHASRSRPGENPAEPCRCEIRLYDSAVVLMPEFGEPWRFPVGEVEGLLEPAYAIELVLEDGEHVRLERIGAQRDPLLRDLRALLAEAQARIAAILGGILPRESAGVIQQASEVMREGKPVPRRKLESLSSTFWSGLEAWARSLGAGESFDFLCGMGRPSDVSVGVKRGLMGDLTGSWPWFLVPIWSTDPAAPGNAVAVEALDGSARATYFFRLVTRSTYRQLAAAPEFPALAEAAVARIARCQLAVNFRREPVYLPEEKLLDPRYRRYMRALRRLPALGELRRRFIGRVMHRDEVQWKKDVEDLLRFHAEAVGESEVWRGGFASSEAGCEPDQD